MKKLSLLRHAKSDWQDPATRDFDRPLNDKGKRVSHAVGQWVATQKICFDYIIASPAVRVRETLDYFIKGYGKKFDIDWDRKIYLASSATILDTVRGYDDEYDHILVVGHNPGIEDIIFDLVADDGSKNRNMVEKKYPTGAFSQLHLSCKHWSEIYENPAIFKIFMPPRNLNPEFGPDVI